MPLGKLCRRAEADQRGDVDDLVLSQMEEGDRHVADHACEAVGASVDLNDVLADGHRGAREDTFHLTV
eukprot:13981642-Alexandrium_andersonii.AAC.1